MLLLIYLQPLEDVYDFELFKQEILAQEHPSGLQRLMKKLRQVAADTHVVPLGEPAQIRTCNPKGPQKKKKGAGGTEKRDSTH